MKIAACDDDLIFLQELCDLLNQYGNQYNCDIESKTFTNPLELVSQIEKGIHYDVIFLDIYMPGINGIQCAKDIRSFDNVVKIVFLTSSSEFAIESYTVRAYQYLLKPVQKENLFLTLRLLEKESETVEKNIIILKSKNGIVKISLSKLVYCEVVNRKIIFHLSNGEECECNLRMNEVEEKLNGYDMFFKPHRSFLVNMDYIHTLTTHGIILEGGVKIPVPREKYAQMKQTYMEYIFNSSDSIVLGNIENNS